MRRSATLLCLLLCLTLNGVGQSIDYASRMRKMGLVDLSTLGPGITLDLRYASTNNFTGKNMYGEMRGAFLVEPAARSLAAALKQLRAINPDYGFVIYDAARPVSVQRKMWQAVQSTAGVNYVAPPRRGGPHNYGVAIDISITYKGIPVDMGTRFDSFSTDSHITAEDYLVKRGHISKQARKNRRLLRKVLTENGFLTYSREWWHFEYCRVGKARRRYPLLNF